MINARELGGGGGVGVVMIVIVIVKVIVVSRIPVKNRKYARNRH